MSNNKVDHYNDLLKLGIDEILQLAELGEQMRWIPVSERLPEKRQICDIFANFSNGNFRICEVTFTNKKKGFDHGTFSLDVVTHWRPAENDRPEVNHE